MKTFLILAGIGLVCLLLIIRLFFIGRDNYQKEREWFTQNLKYEFSAEIDSIGMFNQTVGRVYGRITSGQPLTYREDSLRNSLKKHEKLRLITRHRNDSIVFVFFSAHETKKGDSLRVSSSANTITLFREGKQVMQTPFSDNLNGWGKPPIGN